MAKTLKILFFTISIFELLSQLQFLPFQAIHNFTKPMLMPALALYFLAHSNYFKNFHLKKIEILILISLFFAWLGDIFLMVANINPLYFMLGLASFLVMQLLYIYIFKPFKISDLKRRVWLSTGLILFGLAVFTLLYAQLFTLKIPVFLYFLAILSMVLSAMGLFVREGKVAQIIFIGALLFMVSDSLIAINKFRFDIPYAGFLIMITYIFAQWCIIDGLIKLEKSQY